jgi:hypothetical protein
MWVYYSSRSWYLVECVQLADRGLPVFPGLFAFLYLRLHFEEVPCLESVLGDRGLRGKCE